MKAKHAVYALLGVFCFLVATKLGYCRERAFGYCYQGGHVVITQGLSSDTKVQQSFPSCTVAVYNEGTTTLSNIYADNSGTVKGNPFTSDANGYWFFYANNGRYDVHFYDSDITVPYTQGDYLLCDPADATGAFSCTGGGAGSCPVGALFSQYVDSAQGADGNAGTNWCNSKLTESAGATALPSGGTVREAPNYTGAAATGVPANVNIFRYNQFDTLGSSMQLFAFPDLTTSSENHYAFATNSNSTMADADAAFTAVNAFSATHLITSVLGNLTIPSTSPFRTREQAGVTGIVTDNSATDVYQADGVLGMCYNSGSLGLDCTGVVGIAGNGTTGQSGSMEAMWANLSLGAPTTDAMGLVIRATGGHMPTTQVGSVSGRPNAAIDIAYGGSGAAADAFPTGIFFENQAAGLTNFAFTGNGTLNQPHTDVFTYDRWWDYYSASTPLDTFSVVKLNNNAIADQAAYQAGNYIFQNSTNSSEVVLPINYSGTIKNESIKTVTYSATPTFDRAQGSIQKITLTGDVTSSTLQNCVAGQTIAFDVIEDGVGGHTFSAPANLVGFTAIDTTASAHNRQMFYCDGTSSNSGGYSITTAGSGSGPTLQTNGGNNSSQVLLNFLTSSTDAVGLTVTPSNPAGGQEKFEITGSSFTGNSATATALASYTGFSVYGSNVSAGAWITPSANSQCLMADPTNFATATPSFQTCPSGGISGLTAGFIPLAGSATTITADSALDDGVTTLGVITSTKPITITGNAKIEAVETTAPSGVASSDILYPDSTAHRWKMINNNGTAVAVAGASGAITSGNCAQFTGTTGDIADAGAPCGSGTGAMTNITGSVTPTGCTVSSGVCTVGSATTPVSFASIPGTYNKIIIQITGRFSDSALTSDITGTVNGDTGANYARTYLSTNTTTVATVSAGGLTGWTLLCRLTAATADANIPGNCDVTIPGYAGTTFAKQVFSNSSVQPTLATTTTYYRIMTTGAWNSTSAITSISFADASGGNFIIGTTFIIYGVN